MLNRQPVDELPGSSDSVSNRKFKSNERMNGVFMMHRRLVAGGNVALHSLAHRLLLHHSLGAHTWELRAFVQQFHDFLREYCRNCCQEDSGETLNGANGACMGS